MTAVSATDLTLAIGDSGLPENFTEIGGLQNHRITLRNNPARHHHANINNAWEESLPNSGRQVVTISGQGIFTDSAAEESLRAQAFSSSANNFQISLGNGDSITGAFSVISYERYASMEGATEYQISLQSTGEIIFTQS